MKACENHTDINSECEPCAKAQWVYFHKECAAFRDGVSDMNQEQREKGLFAIGFLYANLPANVHEVAGAVMDGLSRNVVYTYERVIEAYIEA